MNVLSVLLIFILVSFCFRIKTTLNIQVKSSNYRSYFRKKCVMKRTGVNMVFSIVGSKNNNGIYIEPRDSVIVNRASVNLANDDIGLPGNHHIYENEA